MRTLLVRLSNWWFERSPGRIRYLVRDVERLYDDNHDLRARVAALEFVIDRLGTRQVGTPRRHLASVTELHPRAQS